MYEKLKTQEDYREFIRQAIAEKLQSVMRSESFRA
jgi:flagellar biosynthesis chaperone FliJ